MSSALKLSCLLVVLGCLLGTGYSQSDAEFAAKARQMMAVFGNPSVDRNTQARYVPAFVDFYEKYSNRLPLTTQERQKADNFVRSYRARSSPKVDGVSAQGGFPWLEILAPIVGQVVKVITKVIAPQALPDFVNPFI
ncbi:protein Turandot E-like [Drosophila eugracilis]|uniref:protein Turandot E-like n=1 Tax=Drosophila eugracilis TaxID=29029 RepID=UPI001BDA6E5E|nr:protein Turandot E-like [Drosophila eugracilis]